MKKDYLLDDGKIRRCDLNIAKMNIFEYSLLMITEWNYFKDMFEALQNTFVEFCKMSFYFIVNLIFLIFSPITLLVLAFIKIKKAKKTVEKEKEAIERNKKKN